MSKTNTKLTELKNCRITFWVIYDDLERELFKLKGRKYSLTYFDGFVKIVVEPQECNK